MQVPIDILKSHPVNAEIYSLSDIEDLCNSLRIHGQLEPIIVSQNNVIISGHRRYESLKRINQKTALVEQRDILPEEEVSLLIHHNKHRVKTTKEIFSEIQCLESEMAVGQGKRNDLLTSVSSNRGQTTRSKIAKCLGKKESLVQRVSFIGRTRPEYLDEIDKGKLTVEGAYQHLKRIQSQQNSTALKSSQKKIRTIGDSKLYIQCSSKLGQLADQSVDCIITSPPYYKKRVYVEGGGLGNEITAEEYVQNLVKHLRDCHRVLKTTGSFFLVVGDTYESGNQLNIPHRVAILLQTEGWIQKNCIIWHKTNPKPCSSKRSLNTTYEFIFHFVKDIKKYKYNEILDERKTSEISYRKVRNKDLYPKVRKLYDNIARDGKNLGDFWNSGLLETAVAKNVKIEGKEHPAPFPEEVCVLPILLTTDQNDVVLDPFAGVGTTGHVANALGRKFIGYDIKDWM